MKLIDEIDTCCPVAGAPALDAGEATRLAEGFRVLADPARLRLLSIISSHPSREACVCELTGPLGLSQPTISHHLKVLHEAGFLAREKRATWVYYRLVPAALTAMSRVLVPATTADRYAPGSA